MFEWFKFLWLPYIHLVVWAKISSSKVFGSGCQKGNSIFIYQQFTPMLIQDLSMAAPARYWEPLQFLPSWFHSHLNSPPLPALPLGYLRNIYTTSPLTCYSDYFLLTCVQGSTILCLCLVSWKKHGEADELTSSHHFPIGL